MERLAPGDDHAFLHDAAVADVNGAVGDVLS